MTERSAYDFYGTPDDVVEKLFQVVPAIDPYTSGLTYLEPCYGSGKIYRHFPVGSQWAEVQDGKDYLTTQFNRADCVVTNPPFCSALEFLEKSLTEADIVVYLLRLSFLGSQKRKEFWKANPPDSLVILSKRPSFTGGKTDNSEYAWFIFDKKKRLNLEPFYFI